MYPRNQVMGFSIRKTFNAKTLLRATRTFGPGIAAVFPAAAPFVAAAMVLTRDAKKGDPAAQAKIADIKARAAAGDPSGEQSFAALQAGEMIRLQEAQKASDRAMMGGLFRRSKKKKAAAKARKERKAQATFDRRMRASQKSQPRTAPVQEREVEEYDEPDESDEMEEMEGLGFDVLGLDDFDDDDSFPDDYFEENRVEII